MEIHPLQRLHDSEINFSIEAFWQSGFHVKLGDTKNGIKSSIHVTTFTDAVKWLEGQARIYFPHPDYVKNLPH